MEYYELSAEKQGYYFFEHKSIVRDMAHFHNSIEFIFVESGTLNVSLDGEHHVLNAGEACFVDSFCVHMYTGHNAVVYVVVGHRNYFEDFFSKHVGYTFLPFFAFTDFELLRQLLDECDKKRNMENACLVFQGAIQILIGNIAEYVPLQKKVMGKKSLLVCEVLRYAQANLSEDLSLAVLGKRFGYSREYLSRLLHSYLKENWSSYINRLRVMRAEKILKHETKSVLEVVYEVGFESTNTFYRAYRQFVGGSPRRRGT